MVLPILLALAFGMIDFGRFLFTRNNLQSAVREGARMAAARADPLDGQAAQRVADFINATEATNIAASDVSVTCPVVGTPPACRLITVKLTNGYTFTPITPLLSELTTRNLQPSAVFRWEASPD